MRLAQQYPLAYRNWQIHAQLLHEEIVEGSQQTLLALLGEGFFVLLIARVNVANLMLARAATRECEIALRAALGAGRARIVRRSRNNSRSGFATDALWDTCHDGCRAVYCAFTEKMTAGGRK
jgi:putative ABC transport system permease protein